MPAPGLTARHVALFLAVAGLLAAAGCSGAQAIADGGGPVRTDGTGLAPAEDAAGRPLADTAPADGAAPVADANPDNASAPDGSLPGKCGDVTATTAHPPFEAIKRLATTTDEVRILVYGQSISEQKWWEETRDWLRAQYPRGNLVMEQHAHGGCPSQCLLGRSSWFLDGTTRNRVLEDVFAWNPDLIIFNVTGRHDDYETLIRSFKEGCVAFDDHVVPAVHCPATARYPGYKPAEVLIQTYHRVDDVDYNATLPMLPPVPEDQWSYWMSTVWIPGVARRHGAQVAPVWEGWRAYLLAHNLKAAELLSDGAHLNDAGNKVMAALTKPFLCYTP
jgi:hypothetical protein